jgi:peroxiredoxin
MTTRLRSLPVLALAASLSLSAAGCWQGGPGQGEREARSTDISRTAAADGGEMADQPAEGSGVKLTRAESPLRPSQDSATPADEPADPAAPAKLPAAHPHAKAPLPLDNVDTADLTMPEVKLSEHHAAMCVVNVGDKFPEMKLADLSGQPQTLADLQGEKLTLIVFWNGSEPTALEQLADLVKYHHPRFGDQGLAIVAVNTGDPPQLAAELAKEAGAKFPVLVDSDGAAFKQVATARLPRSYLLDANGQVLWFDLEYSATTRRDMVQAIRFSLAH